MIADPASRSLAAQAQPAPPTAKPAGRERRAERATPWVAAVAPAVVGAGVSVGLVKWDQRRQAQHQTRRQEVEARFFETNRQYNERLHNLTQLDVRGGLQQNHAAATLNQDLYQLGQLARQDALSPEKLTKQLGSIEHKLNSPLISNDNATFQAVKADALTRLQQVRRQVSNYGTLSLGEQINVDEAVREQVAAAAARTRELTDFLGDQYSRARRAQSVQNLSFYAQRLHRVQKAIDQDMVPQDLLMEARSWKTERLKNKVHPMVFPTDTGDLDKDALHRHRHILEEGTLKYLFNVLGVRPDVAQPVLSYAATHPESSLGSWLANRGVRLAHYYHNVVQHSRSGADDVFSPNRARWFNIIHNAHYQDPPQQLAYETKQLLAEFKSTDPTLLRLRGEMSALQQQLSGMRGVGSIRPYAAGALGVGVGTSSLWLASSFSRQLNEKLGDGEGVAVSLMLAPFGVAAAMGGLVAGVDALEVRRQHQQGRRLKDHAVQRFQAFQAQVRDQMRFPSSFDLLDASAVRANERAWALLTLSRMYQNLPTAPNQRRGDYAYYTKLLFGFAPREAHIADDVIISDKEKLNLVHKMRPYVESFQRYVDELPSTEDIWSLKYTWNQAHLAHRHIDRGHMYGYPEEKMTETQGLATLGRSSNALEEISRWVEENPKTSEIKQFLLKHHRPLQEAQATYRRQMGLVDQLSGVGWSPRNALLAATGAGALGLLGLGGLALSAQRPGANGPIAQTSQTTAPGR